MLAGLLLVAAVVLVFYPALAGGFVWDDHDNLTLNGSYRGLSWDHLRWMFGSVHRGHYQPLSWISLALDHALWGMNPAGYHLTNLSLHALNALLLWWLARRLLSLALGRGPDRASVVLGAAAASLLFALHPMRVESVAWITERRDLLSACFYLLGLLAYLAAQRRDRRRRWRWLALALLAFVASGLAKAWVVTLPAVLLVLDGYPLRRLTAAGWRGALLEKIPFAVVALLVSLTAFVAQTEAFAVGHSLSDRLLQAGYGVWYYPLKAGWPARLSPLYLLRADSLHDALHLAALAAAVLATLASLLLWRRWPWIFACWAGYGLLLAPVLGLLQAGQQQVADRYSYLALWPLALLAGAAVARLAATPRRGAAAAALLAGLALALALPTRAYLAHWTDDLALWDRAIAMDPQNHVALCNRANARRTAGRLDLALEDLARAIALRPDHGPAYSIRGNIRAQQGRMREALADFQRAVRLSPRSATALCNRASARDALGDRAGAARDAEEGLRRDPRQTGCLVLRGRLAAAAGRLPEALAAFDSALRISPGLLPALVNRANTRRLSGDRGGALSDLREALRLAPPDWPLRAQVQALVAEQREQ
jgi:tetratricopeptide (TPR) repeat protein